MNEIPVIRAAEFRLSDQYQELTLEEEWREFPYGNHDDRLDSVDVACRTADELSIVGDEVFELGVAAAD